MSKLFHDGVQYYCLVTANERYYTMVAIVRLRNYGEKHSIVLYSSSILHLHEYGYGSLPMIQVIERKRERGREREKEHRMELKRAIPSVPDGLSLKLPIFG